MGPIVRLVRARITSRQAIAVGFVVAAVAAADASVIAQETPEEATFRGTWNNRKFGTSGPLSCTATVKDDETWEAKFQGKFMNRDFNYDATIKTSKKSGRTVLQGTATIDGDQYLWSGYVNGKELFGKFRSRKGNNGTFRLRRS